LHGSYDNLYPLPAYSTGSASWRKVAQASHQGAQHHASATHNSYKASAFCEVSYSCFNPCLNPSSLPSKVTRAASDVYK